MFLNKQQVNSVKYFLNGNNMFITGIAGTGKTFILNKIIQWCNENNKKLGITALTGTAAILINGTTIHSWAGIGIGNKPIHEYIEKIDKYWELKKKWITTKILIIDEISMMDDKLFTLIEHLARIVRKNEKPFGGIQLIFCGDFFQLPPINKNNDVKFCFESELWNKCIDNTIILTENMRQKDSIFQKCLEEIRIGQCSKNTEKILKLCINKDLSANGIKPTKLFTLRSSVDKINEEELNKLTSEKKIFNIKSKVINKIKFTENEIDRITDNIDKHNQYEKKLYLAKDAQVMLIKNLDIENGLINGSRGVITHFDENYPVVQFVNGITRKIMREDWENEIENKGKIIRRQIPLILAWAITIHKSQGSTLDCVELDIGKNIFEYGQSYVALSRVKDLNGLSINQLKISKIKANPKVIEFYNTLRLGD